MFHSYFSNRISPSQSKANGSNTLRYSSSPAQGGYEIFNGLKTATLPYKHAENVLILLSFVTTSFTSFLTFPHVNDFQGPVMKGGNLP